MSTIYVDLDDTVLDFLEYLCSVHNQLNAGANYNKEMLKEWSDGKKYFGKYFDVEGIYINLTFKEDAINVLTRLSKRHHVKILTAFPSSISAKEKVEFVQKYMPFIGLENLTLTWDKALLKGDMLIDDSPLFLEDFEGIRVCFDQPYNKNVNCDYRVTNWKGISKLIKELEDNGDLIPSKEVGVIGSN